MKKKFTLTLVLLFLAASFAACSGSDSKPLPTPEVQATLTPTFTPTPTSTPTATNTPTPTPSPIPLITTDEKTNTIVFLSDYKGIRLEPVSDDELNKAINEHLMNFAEEVEVDRPAKMGDIVLIYFVGTIDGVPFEGGTYNSGSGYELTLGSHSFIDNFEEQLVGAKEDDVVTVNVTFPENYHAEELRGKQASFEVTVIYVLENKLPELTDEFVQENLEFDSVSAFKEALLDKLTEESYNDQLLAYLLDNFRIENLSDDELKEFSDNMYNYYYKQAAVYAAFNNADINDVLYYYFGVPDLDTLREISDLTASTHVPFNHILKAIGIYEGIEITDEVLNSWIEANKEDYGYTDAEAFLEDYGKETLVETALIDKVHAFLLDNAVK